MEINNNNYQILQQLDELLQMFHQPMPFMFNYHQDFISKKKHPNEPPLSYFETSFVLFPRETWQTLRPQRK